MKVSEMLRWQWEGYARYHRSRFNLLLHMMVVPLFLFGNVVFVAALAGGSWATALAAATGMLVAVALQGRGHRQEAMPPEPFTGPTNAVVRILLEQWVTFPRFVVSGHWMKAWRGASAV